MNNNKSDLGHGLSPKKIGQGIKAFRQLKNLTVSGVALLCHVPERLIVALESGEEAQAPINDLMNILHTVYPEQFNHNAVDSHAGRLQRVNLQQALQSIKTDDLFNQPDCRKNIKEICRLLAEVIGVEYVGVYLFEGDKDTLTGSALYKASEKACVSAGDYMRSEAESYYGVLQENRLLVSEDVMTDPRTLECREIYERYDIRSLIDTGIFVAGELVGTLSIEHVATRRAWLEEEILLSSRVAERVADMLAEDKNREQEKEHQLKLRREKIQNQAVLSLLTGDRAKEEDLQSIFDYISKLVAEVLAVECAGVYLFDDEQKNLSAASVFSLSANDHWGEEKSYLVKDAKDYYLELEQHRTLVLEDCTGDERLTGFTHIEDDGVQSLADTLIRVHGKSVGILNVEHVEKRAWYPDEIAFMGTVADHVAQMLLADKMHQDTVEYASISKRRQELEQMVNNGQFVVVDWADVNCNVKFISESIKQFGYSQEDFYSSAIRFESRVHPADVEAVKQRFRVFENNVSATKMHIEYRFLTADDEVRWVEEHARIVRGSKGEIERYYMMFHDVTSRKQAEISLLESKEKMQKMAFYDALTGLENRELFKQQLEYAIRIAHRQTKTVALLYLDVDNFKMVNDTLGHDAGDTLLKIIADRLMACVRETDSVARIGGDEFTVLLTEVKGRPGTQRAAEKILATFTKPIRLYDQELIISPSIGITLCPEDGTDSTLLMKNADLAMYHAKSMGRNNFQFFNENMNAELSKRVLLEAEMRQALEEKHFQLYFQPIIDLNESRCVSVEALVRWVHPEKGLIPPDIFIPLAEDTGLIIPLGEQIFEMACRQVSRFNQVGLDGIKVAVNLSARQLHDPDLIEVVKRHLGSAQVQASQMGLEVTESLLMDKVEDAISTLGELKDLGFSLSIDDFGTGYSSLSYLKRLPIDTVKVDRSFVRDIPEDKSDMEITAAVIAMAHKLNLTVVAEGVESLEQQVFLAQNHCNYAQGFYYSRPTPADELEAVIERLCL